LNSSINAFPNIVPLGKSSSAEFNDLMLNRVTILSVQIND